MDKIKVRSKFKEGMFKCHRYSHQHPPNAPHTEMKISGEREKNMNFLTQYDNLNNSTETGQTRKNVFLKLGVSSFPEMDSQI